MDDEAVVASASDYSNGLLVELEAGNWGGSLEDVDGLVWVVNVPDVGLGRHFVGHLLETLDGIPDSELGDAFWVPGYFAHGAFDVFFISK